MCLQKTTWAEKFEAQPLPPPSITKSDSDFELLGVEFVESADDVSITDLNNLFEKVGFPRRDPEKLRTALSNSYHCVWIRCAKKTRMAKMGQMIGFARATSDGALSATIWDVAVNPGWQRAGLGRALMERLTRKLVVDGIPTVALYAEPAVVALYEKLGYVKDPDGIKGMAFKQRKKKTLPTR